MAENRFPVDDFLPTGVKLIGNSRAGRENGSEAELDVRLRHDFLENQAFMDFVPAIGEAAGIEQDDTIAGDAEIFEVGVEGKNSPLPTGLAQIDKAVQPEMNRLEFPVFGKAFDVFAVDGARTGVSRHGAAA